MIKLNRITNAMSHLHPPSLNTILNTHETFSKHISPAHAQRPSPALQSVGNVTSAMLRLVVCAASEYLCYSASEATDGVDAAETLMDIFVESAGDNCAEDSFGISYGDDTNGNGVLDEEEIVETEYLCEQNDITSLQN